MTATVNFATEKATVTFATDVAPEGLVATVEATRYSAALPRQSDSAVEKAAAHDTDVAAPPRRLVLTVPVVLLAMIAALQFDYW